MRILELAADRMRYIRSYCRKTVDAFFYVSMDVAQNTQGIVKNRTTKHEMRYPIREYQYKQLSKKGSLPNQQLGGQNEINPLLLRGCQPIWLLTTINHIS